MMEAFAPTVAQFLLPVNQFGNAVKGGLEVMLHVARSLIDRFLSPDNPLRVLLLLYIANMFNSCSPGKQ